MIKFSDLVKTKISGCPKCFSILYILPCQIDKNIVKYFKSFGEPIYSLKSVSLLKIDTDHGFHIEGRLKAKVIKFTMPKKLKKHNLNKIEQKIKFENCLLKWLENKLGIKITR